MIFSKLYSDCRKLRLYDCHRVFAHIFTFWWLKWFVFFLADEITAFCAHNVWEVGISRYPKYERKNNKAVCHTQSKCWVCAVQENNWEGVFIALHLSLKRYITYSTYLISFVSHWAEQRAAFSLLLILNLLLTARENRCAAWKRVKSVNRVKAGSLELNGWKFTEHHNETKNISLAISTSIFRNLARNHGECGYTQT